MILSKIYRKLVGYRTRYDYWGCSDVAHKMQQVHKMPPKPAAATSKEWEEWRVAAKKASPAGYWITEEGLDLLQDIFLFIPDVYHNIYRKLHNIFVSQSHVIRTGLPRGEWYDCRTKIEEGLFNLLVEFVEIEKASRQDNVSDWSRDPDNTDPYVEDRRLSGLSYLDWEIGLGEESPNQAETAKEVKEIYLWIKDVKDNRPDPYDATGWSDYCDSKENILDVEDESEEQRAHVRIMLNEVHEMEQQQQKEDTDMLVRIVKIREGMWA